MKHPLSMLMIGAVALGGMATVTLAQEAHTMVTPEEIEWKPAPPSVPPGAEVAVLYGNPGEEGPFAMRLKLPEGYAIPPHAHPRPEVVTVLSGTFLLGTGETAERETTEALPEGSFFAFEPGMTHYVFTDEETVVQINTTGPWGIEYANPEDDPRKGQ
jgi:quercetin dioxygenase-like cupin family protein